MNGLEFSLPSTCMFSNVKHEIFGDLARKDWLLGDWLKAFRNNANMRRKTEKRLEDITITKCFVEIVLSRVRPTHSRIGILNFEKMMIQIFEKKYKKLGFKRPFRDLKTFAEGRKEVSLTIK